MAPQRGSQRPAGTDTALATLPGGSTNVFARILGLPDDSVDAVTVLLEALDAGNINRIGLGAVEGRYFLFHCGVGFDAAVVEQVERRGPWKRWAGHPLFMYARIDTWIRGSIAPTRRCVSSTPTGRNAHGHFSIIMNANPYTFLGNRAFELVPELTLQDPLAAVTLEELNLRTLGPVAARARPSAAGGRKISISPRVCARSSSKATRLALPGRRRPPRRQQAAPLHLDTEPPVALDALR